MLFYNQLTNSHWVQTYNSIQYNYSRSAALRSEAYFASTVNLMFTDIGVLQRNRICAIPRGVANDCPAVWSRPKVTQKFELNSQTLRRHSPLKTPIWTVCTQYIQSDFKKPQT